MRLLFHNAMVMEVEELVLTVDSLTWQSGMMETNLKETKYSVLKAKNQSMLEFISILE